MTPLHRYRIWRARRMAKTACRILGRLDKAMQAAHLSRAERRRTWRELKTGHDGGADLIEKMKAS